MRTKTKVLFAVAGVFYIWYAAAGILLNCTTWDYTLTGTAGRVYNFFTHFYIEMEAFSAFYTVLVPIVFFVYTGLVLLLYKPFTKTQKFGSGFCPLPWF